MKAYDPFDEYIEQLRDDIDQSLEMLSTMNSSVSSSESPSELENSTSENSNTSAENEHAKDDHERYSGFFSRRQNKDASSSDGWKQNVGKLTSYVFSKVAGLWNKLPEEVKIEVGSSETIKYRRRRNNKKTKVA